MLWEHEPTGKCFHSFFEFFQTFTSDFYRLIGNQGAARVSYHEYKSKANSLIVLV